MDEEQKKEEAKKKLKEAEKKRKEEEEKKKLEKKNYDVSVEMLVPMLLKYRVLAVSPEEAIKMVVTKRVRPRTTKPPEILRGKFVSFTVFIAGTINRLLYKKV